MSSLRRNEGSLETISAASRYATRDIRGVSYQKESGINSVEEAAAYYRQALALASELGMRPLQAHCHLGLGKLYGKMGRWEQAHAELSTAIELYQAMAMTFWLPQAGAALAQMDAR